MRRKMVRARPAPAGLAKERPQRLSRARSIIADCMHVLVHAADESAMLQDMCRIVVERGGHRSAWIGFAEHDEEKTVRPVASAGIALREVQGLGLTWGDKPKGRGAVGTALRTRRPKAIDDYFAQAEYAAWREFAATHGFRSGAALPLLVDESCSGVLMINSPEACRFDAEEVALLAELAADIAFGIQSLRARQRRERAEQTLRESEERFRSTFEQAAVGMAHVALDGRLLRVNQKACDILGYAREELLGLDFRAITHPDDIEANVALREAALAGRQASYAMQKRYLRKDGGEVWTSLTVSLARDATDRPAYFISVIEDITARKNAEREIERQHRLLREVIDAIPSMIFLRDAEGRYVLCNRTLAEFFGRSVEWIIGRRNDDFIVPTDERVVPAQTDRQLLATGAPVGPYEITHLRDGERHWFQYEKRPLKSSHDGRPLVLGVGTEITQRKRMEQALRESEERYRKLIEMSPEATLVHADWRIVLANQAALDLVGAGRPEQLLGREMLDLLAPEFRDRARARIERLYRDGTAEPRVESVYLRLDGTRIAVEVSVAPFVHEGRPAAQVIARDIGDRKRAEQALRESESLFREFAANTPGIYWVRETGSERILYVSPAWEKVTGWPQPPDRKAFFAMIHPEDVDRALADARAAPHGGVDHEYRIIRLDGGVRWLHVRTYAVRDDRGEVYRVAGVGEDTTDRKRAEDQLRQFRLAMDASIDSIYLTDVASMRFVDVNEAACQRLGYSREQLLEKCPHELLGADCEKIRREYDEVIAAGDQGTRTESRYVTSDGSVGWTELDRRAVRVNDQWLIVTIARDISDRKRTELAFRESEEHLRQLASNIPEAFWIEELGSERLLYSSPALVRITGWWMDSHGVDAQHLQDIVAPEDYRRVLAAANAAMHGGFDEQYRIVRPDGTRRWVHSRTFPIRNSAGTVYRIAGVMEDISEQKAAEDRLTQIALYDELTNLPNRTLFYRSVQQTVAHASAQARTGAVLFLDLDRFKNVNDTLGHSVGDDLLREVATRLVRSIRARDTLGRLGGDEFAVLLSNLESAEDAATVAEKVLKALAEPVTLEGQEVFVSASIGIAVFPADGEDPDLLIRAADTAMYRAKSAGRNAYRFYTAEMNARALDRLKLEGLLRRAIERSEFLLHYQPKVLSGDARLCGAEALLRWKHPERGLVSPAEFIPLLEETGLIVPAGEWVIGEVCRQIRAWREAGLTPVPVAINLSGRQFLQGDLADLVRRTALAAGIDPELLEFELTEGTLMSHAEDTIGILDRLKHAGVALSIDDFGTGYSSLAYLKRFPLDALKIDRSFITDATSNSDDAAIVKAIIRMAHELDLKVVAEGVETQAQLEFLRKRGCDEIQGYLFSKPLGSDAFADYLRAARETEVSHATH